MFNIKIIDNFRIILNIYNYEKKNLLKKMVNTLVIPDILENINQETLQELRNSLHILNNSLSNEVKGNLCNLHSDLLNKIGLTPYRVADPWVLKLIGYNKIVLDSIAEGTSDSATQKDALEYYYSLIRAKASYSLHTAGQKEWTGILSQVPANTFIDPNIQVNNITIDANGTDVNTDEIRAKFFESKNLTYKSSQDYTDLQNARNKLKYSTDGSPFYDKSIRDWNHMRGKNTFGQWVKMDNTNLIIKGRKD